MGGYLGIDDFSPMDRKNSPCRHGRSGRGGAFHQKELLILFTSS